MCDFFCFHCIILVHILLPTHHNMYHDMKFMQYCTSLPHSGSRNRRFLSTLGSWESLIQVNMKSWSNKVVTCSWIPPGSACSPCSPVRTDSFFRDYQSIYHRPTLALHTINQIQSFSSRTLVALTGTSVGNIPVANYYWSNRQRATTK